MSPAGHGLVTKHCYEEGHVVDCPIHFIRHSPRKKCVQCASEEKVRAKAEKEAREAEEKAKTRENAKSLSGFLKPQPRLGPRRRNAKTSNLFENLPVDSVLPFIFLYKGGVR